MVTTTTQQVPTALKATERFVSRWPHWIGAGANKPATWMSPLPFFVLFFVLLCS